MKPLVYYCRWQGAVLRLRGRDNTAVWGDLIFTSETNEETAQPFHFTLKTNQLTLTTLHEEKVLKLDEMGVVLQEL